MTNPIAWHLKDLKAIPQNGLKVMSTFSCGGGSSMGWKLAGASVIAANDIDPEMAYHYKLNLNPKHYFLCPIKDLLKIDLPNELYNLDVLEGSPPCSSFSMAGNREKDWGKKKHFREGQAEQVLDDLFFSDLQVLTDDEIRDNQASQLESSYWNKTKAGNSLQEGCLKISGKASWFNNVKVDGANPSCTLSSSHANFTHWSQCRRLTYREWKRLGSFPDDYQAKTDKIGKYMIGMSVPPRMTEQVAIAVIEQWLS